MGPSRSAGRLKPAPGIRRFPLSLPPSFVHRLASTIIPRCVGTVARQCTAMEVGSPPPRGSSLGSGLFCPDPSSLNRPQLRVNARDGRGSLNAGAGHGPGVLMVLQSARGLHDVKRIGRGHEDVGLADGGGDACSSGHSLQLCAPCRKDWLFVRKEALVSLADGAASARDPTAPSAVADPGLVLVRGPDARTTRMRRRVGS
jgi:hypothetical protein